MVAAEYDLRKTNERELISDARQHKIIRSSPVRHREFVPFVGLILVVLAMLAYYLGTTQRFSIQGHLVKLKAGTIIQYFGNDEGIEEVKKSKNQFASKLSTAVKSNVLQEKTRNLDKTMKSLNTVSKIRPNVGLKLSSKDKTNEFLESNQTKQKGKRNLNLRPKSSSQNTPTIEEKFNFDAWYGKKTVEVCGTGWQENYRKVHANILSKHMEEKYLVYLCPGTRQGCCGYGNRLRAVVSLFYLSVLTDRAFLIDWRAPEPIENHLKPRHIQWNYTEPLDVCTGLQIRKHYWGSTKTDIREAEGWIIQDSSHFKKWLTTTDLKEYFDWPVEEITTIWYFAEGGLTLNPYLLKRAKELAITPLTSISPKYNLIGCAFDFLFSKSKAVENKLNEMRAQLQFDKGPIIGIHIRTGDDQFDYFSSDNDRSRNVKNVTRLLKFFDCAAKVERKLFGNRTDQRTKVRWFVSTDNSEVRDFVQESYPRKVVASNLTIQHLDILFNTTIFNFTAECNYTDASNTTLVCYNVEVFNLTEYCANRTNNTLEAENNSTINGTGPFTDGIIAMLVDHFLLAESDFLILCDSSFGSTAVGLSMRDTDSYILADRGCVDLASAQKITRLRYFGRR